jgi:dTDP-glucose pyrophosphorylase
VKNWSELLLSSGSTIGDAIAKIDSGGMQITLVVDSDGKLLGTITDGDIRRGLLRGLTLNASAIDVTNCVPTTASPQDDRSVILAVMKRKLLHQIPLVDERGHVVGLETLDEMLLPPRRDNLIVLMAGGEGVRLRPLTNDIPKPMLRVGDKPMLESIIDSFASYGFWRFCIAVNYKAEFIERYFGDGAKWDVQVEYLRESEKLGTAGALSLIKSAPTEPVLVMNADILTKVDFGNILNFHHENRAAATLCVREYTHIVPYGVIQMDGNGVLEIEEKPIHRSLVSAGIYVLDPAVFKLLQNGQHLDMPELLETLLKSGQNVAGFPIHEYWLDIGRHEDLQSAQQYVSSGQ